VRTHALTAEETLPVACGTRCPSDKPPIGPPTTPLV
jgi:hypothetical protein